MIAFILFAVSLLILTLMLYIRVSKIRSGKIQAKSNQDSFEFGRIDMISLKNTAGEYAKQYAHVSVLILLKAWIKATYFVKRKTQAARPKIKSFLRKIMKHPEKKNEGISHFLSNISEYKEKLRHATERMKREHEEKHGN